MEFEKNGYKFEIKVRDIQIVKEEEATVIYFYIMIIEVGERKYGYGIRGSIEESLNGHILEFDNGHHFTSELTLVNGDRLNPEFNNAIKAFFKENCDLESLIYRNLSNENRKKFFNKR
jgi:hypothetical protein